jgi:hypothetical protein
LNVALPLRLILGVGDEVKFSRVLADDADFEVLKLVFARLIVFDFFNEGQWDFKVAIVIFLLLHVERVVHPYYKLGDNVTINIKCKISC